jgi:hypothetical protein
MDAMDTIDRTAPSVVAKGNALGLPNFTTRGCYGYYG